ncbi:regulator of nonsense transcription [Saguinus oedipus]|uniref:Regulator of nonsense transcription n=1 Tax=Saguinus oedipus TaxID=9490 RepID=A0ABQ9WAH9_SAGOE|nr:regulator of nonsense transcription [Saguinus oedipus]
MRSEKEGAGGPRAAAAARGPSGREKPSAVEVQFYRDSPQRQPETPPTSSSGCGGGAGKPREEKRTALSKVVIRRLPPGLTKEQLEEQLHPLPAHDYFEFFAADLRRARVVRPEVGEEGGAGALRAGLAAPRSSP